MRSNGPQFKEIARHLIINRKGLALEMGLTVFLGGMVPLALSFTVIFGVGLAFAMDYGILSNAIDLAVTNAIIIQIVLILLFYVLLMFFAPHTQGMTKIFRHFSTSSRRRARAARWRSRLVGIAAGRAAGHHGDPLLRRNPAAWIDHAAADHRP